MSARLKKKKPFAFLVRDMVVAQLRDYGDREHDELASIIEYGWLSDRRINRMLLYAQAMGEVDRLVETKGLSVAAACRKLYRKYGSNSPDSFARTLRSQRPLLACMMRLHADFQRLQADPNGGRR
jgi:hypothetical protein